MQTEWENIAQPKFFLFFFLWDPLLLYQTDSYIGVFLHLQQWWGWEGTFLNAFFTYCREQISTRTILQVGRMRPDRNGLAHVKSEYKLDNWVPRFQPL